MTESVLVTGGTGFIGSHVAVELARAGLQPVLLDNLSNSEAGVAASIEALCGARVPFVCGDVRDGSLLRDVMRQHRIGSVIHMAGLKAVGESVEKPLIYWDHNLVGSLRLIEAMAECGIRRLVFSSSCTVYGEPERLPIREDHPRRGVSAYGRTKLAIEEMLQDLHRSDPRWRIGMLRYFNPIGAHESGRIGENPSGLPNNLMPYLLRVASGQLPVLNVWGSDYPTPDGTGIRDYIHVVDIAEAHVCALERLDHLACRSLNVGTGRGWSVLEVIQAFEAANGVKIPYELRDRRPGDITAAYADPSLATEMLGWRTRRSLEDMCRDAWRFQQFHSGRHVIS